MRYTRALVLCIIAVGILLVPFPGIADITPIDYHAAPSGGGVSPKSSHPTIRMESEEVIIQLKPYTYAVDAVFHMFNSGETTTERIGFPKRAMGRFPGPLGGVDDFIRFEVSVDGRNVPFVEEFSLFKRAQKFLEGLRSRRVEHYSWMMGKARFPGRTRTTIRVSYQAQYDNCGFRCQKAVYVYGTGRQWKETIGKAAFIIDSTRLGKKASANVAFSSSATRKNLLKQRLISDTVVRYEIRNLEPDPRGAVSIGLVTGESEKNDTNILVSAASNGRLRRVRALLKRGADVNAKNTYGKTPLMGSAGGGYLEVTKLLLDKGADVNAKSKHGETALRSALSDVWLDRGYLEIARLLMKHGARPTTLPTAAFVGDLSTLQHLMSGGAKDTARIDLRNPSALTTAAMGGHIDVVRFLLHRGGEVYTRNKQREAALREAAAAGHSDVVKLLLEMDVDVNARDTLRRSAINRAASQGQAEVVTVLLAGGADIETRDDRANRTPLMRAAHSGQLEVVKVLLEKGADVNAKDENDVTALTLANGKDIDEIEKVLKAHGATK